MKKLFVLLIFCLPILLHAQEENKGIRFETGLQWKEIMAKAQVEHKLIFMDCFATWCGPCKTMDKEIFPLKEVGNYFNDHFVCVRVQMDKTPHDLQLIKDWYKDAASIAETYRISAYPTYMFFSADGQALHEIVGTSNTGIEFIGKAMAALDTNKQYFTLTANWEEHKRDSAFLQRAIIAAQGAGNEKQARLIANNYLDCLREPLTKSNIRLLDPLVLSEADNGFALFLNNATAVNQFMDSKDWVEDKLGRIIFNEEIAPVLYKNTGPIDWKKTSANIQEKYKVLNKKEFSRVLDLYFQNYIGKELIAETKNKEMNTGDWLVISNKLKHRFPGYDCGMIMLGNKMQYYGAKKMWQDCARAALSMIEQYGKIIGDIGINEISWNPIFLNCCDNKILISTLKQMELVVKNLPEDPRNIDTYANLLYKTGQRKEAMIWEIKAVSLAGKSQMNDADFRETLTKMQKWKPTWNDKTRVVIANR